MHLISRTSHGRAFYGRSSQGYASYGHAYPVGGYTGVLSYERAALGPKLQPNLQPRNIPL
jgi:hypothetical protein